MQFFRMSFVASVQLWWKQKLLKKLLKAEGVWSESVFLSWYLKYPALALSKPAIKSFSFKKLLSV